MRHKWDRLRSETDKAWQAFQLYKNQSLPRNKLQAFRQHSGNPAASRTGGQFSRWAKKHRWKERLLAYDRSIDQQKFRVKVEALLNSDRDAWLARKEAEERAKLLRRLRRTRANTRKPFSRP